MPRTSSLDWLARASRSGRAASVAASVALAVLPLANAGAASEQVLPLFTIAKSENKNQVQYTVRVDEHCAPAGTAPVSAYWRMLERGPAATEAILSIEEQAYGLANQSVVASDANGGVVHAVLHALPSRPVTVVTSRGSDGTCQAVARVSISGAPANLFNVYARLKWDGVEYLLVQGYALEGGRVVREKIAR